MKPKIIFQPRKNITPTAVFVNSFSSSKTTVQNYVLVYDVIIVYYRPVGLLVAYQHVHITRYKIPSLHPPPSLVPTPCHSSYFRYTTGLSHKLARHDFGQD